MNEKSTIKYYDRNWELFIEGTLSADMSEHYDKFLFYLPTGGTVVDAGCGSGRDAKYFKEKGYKVLAFDYSEKMVELASKHSDISVMHCDFLDFETPEKVQGIWACASLLHIEEVKQRAVLERYKRFLQEGGVFFMSFKYGEEMYEKDGRIFYCHTLESLRSMILETGGYEILHLYTTEDVRKDRKNELWSSAVIRRKGER